MPAGLKEGTFSAFRSPNRSEADGYAVRERPVAQLDGFRIFMLGTGEEGDATAPSGGASTVADAARSNNESVFPAGSAGGRL
jgi:hypothetical protein